MTLDQCAKFICDFHAAVANLPRCADRSDVFETLLHKHDQQEISGLNRGLLWLMCAGGFDGEFQDAIKHYVT